MAGRRTSRTPTKHRKKSPYKILYAEYLKSESWRCLRAVVKRRDVSCRAVRKSECGGCFHVHHILYRACLLDSTADDLILLCENHHNLIHRVVSRRKVSLISVVGGSAKKCLNPLRQVMVCRSLPSPSEDERKLARHALAATAAKAKGPRNGAAPTWVPRGRRP